MHVTVERGVAVLHGEVGSAEDARRLERAVEAVSGVAGVESDLHVGLDAGDPRPSQGRAVHPPSDSMRRLVEAATHAGVDAGAARPVVRAVLATLVAIVVVTAVSMIGRFHGVPTVGDKGALPHSLPLPGLPSVPMSLATLRLVWVPAVTMALVGLLETQMTARLVDDLTDTGSDKRRESVGQGIANLVTGIFVGMGGCAMIGQTMINVKAGARTRVSTFLAGVFLLMLVVVLNPVVSQIPMAALVAVMFVVSYSTFDWHSIAPSHLRRLPKSETAVMLVTVVLTVATGNLSVGVLAGVILAALLFARRVQRIASVVWVTPDHHRWHLHLPGHHPRRAPSVEPGQSHAPSDLDGHSAVYVVTGELFFASSSDLTDHFDDGGDPAHVIIDLSDSHIWDASAVAALAASSRSTPTTTRP